MSTPESTSPTSLIRAQRVPRWYTGRSELFVAAAVIVLAGLMTVGVVTMQVPEGTAWPGPQFFPTIVVAFLYLVGIALAIDVLRHPQRAHVADDPTELSNEMLEELGGLDQTSEIRVVSPEDNAPEQSNRAGLDWRTLAITVAALAAFSFLMPIIGWLLTSAALFWVIAWAFGSKRPVFDIAIAAVIGGATQLAFSAALGLSLPAGILEGVFSWIS